MRSTRHGSVCTQSLGPRESSNRWSVVVGSLRRSRRSTTGPRCFSSGGRSRPVRTHGFSVMTPRITPGIGAAQRPRRRCAARRRAPPGCARGWGRQGRSSPRGCPTRRTGRRRSSRTSRSPPRPSTRRTPAPPRRQAGERPGCGVGDHDVQPVEDLAHVLLGAAAMSRSGAKRKLTVTTHSSGTTLPATPPRSAPPAGPPGRRSRRSPLRGAGYIREALQHVARGVDRVLTQP